MLAPQRPQGQRKRVPDLGSAEPKGALVLRLSELVADGAHLYGACYMNGNHARG